MKGHIKNQIINFMRNFKYYFFAVVALVMGVSLASCKNDPDMNEGKGNGSLKAEVQVVSVHPGGAKLQIVTCGIKEFAYVDNYSDMPETAIFVAGTTKTIENPSVETVTELEIMGKDANTEVTVLFAFRKSNDEFYGEVVEVKFTTTNYEGALTVVDRRYDGFAVHVVVPAETKARGNALRYATASLPMYNYSKMEGSLEIDMLLFNAQQWTEEDRTVRYDEYNSYERDENGNVVEDGAGYADAKTPGEPGVFLIGEYSYMDDEDEMLVYMDRDDDGVKELFTVSIPMEVIDPETGEEVLWTEEYVDENGVTQTRDYTYYSDNAVWSFPAGWSAGYYMPLFDFERWITEGKNDDFDAEKCWTGYYDRIQVDTLEPEEFDGTVKIRNLDMTPINGTVEFTPTENVAFYNVMIMEESEYQNVVLPLLDNNESYLKWFTASYFAMMTFGSQMIAGNETKEIKLSSWFVDMKGMQGEDIRVLCTAMGDNEGKTQVFSTHKFTMPVVTKDAPQVVVTPVPSTDPYTVTFNIKAPNKDAYEGYHACEYVREFNAAIKETTYNAFMRSLGDGNKFTSEDIKAINSDEGLMYTVSSRESATTRLAVLIYNDEGTANNNLNDPESSAIAEYTTPAANFPTRVNSPLFDELVGDWVASAPMSAYDSDAGAWVLTGETYSSDVTIASGITYPETLSQEVYDLYKTYGFDRDATDALYEEFVALAEAYNARTRGFNRLLCLGYNLTDEEYLLDQIATPFDLFTATDYSSSTTDDLFYDFGPKWNLEIDADGKVWLPMDISKEFPMATWNFGIEYTFYMLGVGQASYIGAPVYKADGSLLLDSRFPVEVSEDRNTLTIKPIHYAYKDADGKGAEEIYYPCVTQLQYGQATPTSPRVAGDVVLKRKTSATPTQKNVAIASDDAPAVKSFGNAPVVVERTKFNRTKAESVKIKEFKQFVPETKYEPGMEAFRRRANALVEKTYGVKID